jgi:hypothetical protein
MSLQLGERTLTILKNWSGINPGFVAREGTHQVILSPDRTLVGMTEFEESLPRTCGLKDLRTLVNALESVEKTKATLDFQENAVYIRYARHAIKYVYSQPDLLVKEWSKYDATKLRFPETPMASMTLSEAEFFDLRKSAAIMKLDEMVIQWDGTRMLVLATDLASAEASDRVVATPENAATGAPAEQFGYAFKSEQIHKLPEGPYKIELATTGKRQMGKFTCLPLQVSYFLGAQALKDPILLDE